MGTFLYWVLLIGSPGYGIDRSRFKTLPQPLGLSLILVMVEATLIYLPKLTRCPITNSPQAAENEPSTKPLCFETAWVRTKPHTLHKQADVLTPRVSGAGHVIAGNGATYHGVRLHADVRCEFSISSFLPDHLSFAF